MITVSEKQAMIEDFERLILVSPEQIITAPTKSFFPGRSGG